MLNVAYFASVHSEARLSPVPRKRTARPRFASLALSRLGRRRRASALRRSRADSDDQKKKNHNKSILIQIQEDDTIKHALISLGPWRSRQILYLSNHREENVSQFLKSVLFRCLQNVCRAAQGGHLVNKILLLAFLKHRVQHLPQGWLTCCRLLQLYTARAHTHTHLSMS